MGTAIMGFFILFLVLFIYFIPSVNAYSKKKKNAGAVFALNVFLGWTLVGWVVALVWSATVDPEPVIVNAKSDAIDLEKLSDLKTKGIISEEEFQAKKKQLLGV